MSDRIPTPGTSAAPHPAPGGASIPRPAGIFDPVGRALDTIGDRWTLSLVRQLLLGPVGFQELRKRTGIAPRVLSGRLRQMIADGLIETVSDGARSHYAVSDRGRSLEPVVVALGRWWIQHGIEDFHVDMGRFTETSVQSVMHSLPLMLREERAQGVQVLFEVRLTGDGATPGQGNADGGVSPAPAHLSRCDGPSPPECGQIRSSSAGGIHDPDHPRPRSTR